MESEPSENALDFLRNSAELPPKEKRKGPGRPPKLPPAPFVEKKGVGDEPSSPDSILELSYDRPQDFKGIFMYFKNLKARDIHVRCRKNKILFFARDHSELARTVASIDCNKVNWYYCGEEELCFGINQENVEKIFSSIDKKFYKLALVMSRFDRDHLDIVFRNAIIERECRYQIVLSNFDADSDLYASETMLTEDALNSFKVSFTLDAKDFKKSVTDIFNYSPIMTIEKFGPLPMQITYTMLNLHQYNEVYRNPKKISLKSDIEDSESFTCTMNTTIVKSVASSMVTDETCIMCRRNDILFRSTIDGTGVEICTFIRADQDSQ